LPRETVWKIAGQVWIQCGQAQPDEDQTRPSVQLEPAGDQAQPDAQSETRRRVTVREAAEILGTTVEGVRSRIKRGSLDSMRVEGTVYVLLTPDQVD
jgi:DNA-directed RNA polymerase specialized sigma24 family protein